MSSGMGDLQTKQLTKTEAKKRKYRVTKQKAAVAAESRDHPKTIDLYRSAQQEHQQQHARPQ